MKFLLLFLLFLSGNLLAALKPPLPHEVVILYNSSLEESLALAKYYAKKRQIPATNLVGLPLSLEPQINRKEYEETLLEPLKAKFTKEQWWTTGLTQVEKNNIKVLVCMKGVPYKIQRFPIKNAKGETLKKPFQQVANEASVDSELSLMGHFTYPVSGFRPNPYYRKEESFRSLNLSNMVMVGRIDAPDLETCTRMIDDALLAEKKGLWGYCYLDEAHKGGGYVIGDQWLKSIQTLNKREGIPTITDHNKNTFTQNYPMQHASYYYGWYSHKKSGPFLNPQLKFPRGAVAVHIHSFSAANIQTTSNYWVGTLLKKGACATLGNVYEPYLSFTHHLDIFHDRLLKGYTLIEAASMAHPVLSWQGVVLGDPLYRPGAQFSNKKIFQSKEHLDFKTTRLAALTWKESPQKQNRKIRSIAKKKKSAILYESLGLNQILENNFKNAQIAFHQAATCTEDRVTLLRLKLHEIEMLRMSQRKEEAITFLHQLRKENADLPENLSVVGLLNILDPPPPPPVTSESGNPKTPQQTPPPKK